MLSLGPDDPAGLGLRCSRAGSSVATRGWPAPLVVAIPGRAEWPAHWSAAVRERLQAMPARFRCPEHPLFETIAAEIEVPVLVVDTFLPDRRGACSMSWKTRTRSRYPLVSSALAASPPS